MTVLSRKAVLMAGAVANSLKPKLAKDQKIDIPSLLVGVSTKNFKEKAPAVLKAFGTALDGKLATGIAMDATLADIGKVMDEMSEVPMEEGLDTDPNSGLPMGVEEMKKKALDGDPCETIKALLAGKVDDETIAKICAAVTGEAGAMDEDDDDDEEKKKKKAEGAMDAKLKTFVSKDDLDKAVRMANDTATKNAAELRDAEKFVRPYVGELAIACDTALAVFHAAGKALGIEDIEKVDSPVALRALIKAQPLLGEKQRQPFAQDAAPGDAYFKRFPDAARVQVGGNN